MSRVTLGSTACRLIAATHVLIHPRMSGLGRQRMSCARLGHQIPSRARVSAEAEDVAGDRHIGDTHIRFPTFGWGSTGSIVVLEASAAPEFGLTWLGNILKHTPSAAAKMTAITMPAIQRIIRPRLLSCARRKLWSESCRLSGSLTLTLVDIRTFQTSDGDTVMLIAHRRV